MGKLINMIMIMSGVTLLFYFGGLLEGTPTTTLLTLILNPENLQRSDWFVIIGSTAALVLAVISTVIARNVQSDFYLMIPIVEVFLSFGWDFLVIYQKMSSVSEIAGNVAVLFFGGFMLMYVILVIEWWRGVDT